MILHFKCDGNGTKFSFLILLTTLKIQLLTHPLKKFNIYNKRVQHTLTNSARLVKYIL